jgi:hypothetical protein
MEGRSEQATRDRAILISRLATIGSAAGALGLTWLFSNLSADYFSGKPAAAVTPPPPPKVPVAAVPVQAPPAVIQTVVHHPYQGRSAPAPAPAGAPPQPPGQNPAPPPPPPPPPVCHSTPSKPC